MLLGRKPLNQYATKIFHLFCLQIFLKFIYFSNLQITTDFQPISRAPNLTLTEKGTSTSLDFPGSQISSFN